MTYELSVPTWFDPSNAERLYQVPYGERADQAVAWRKKHDIRPAATDNFRVAVLVIDNQNTFCLPSGELFVGGRSGRGAIEDSVRFAEWLYRNMRVVTKVFPTFDTHTAAQIFHPLYWVNNDGEHPAPSTIITREDVENGLWKVSPAMAYSVLRNPSQYAYLQRHALHYVGELERGGKYPLMVWPYHSMLGGVGHALVGTVEEALHFHSIARHSQWEPQIKGGQPLTENYSIFRPEVLTDADGRQIAQKNSRLFQMLLEFDAVIICGQAKSHCVAWTISDLLGEIAAKDKALVEKVYLMEDVTSPVFIPKAITGLPDDIDFTDQADQAFRDFAAAGMHVVRSTTPMHEWPGLEGKIAA